MITWFGQVRSVSRTGSNGVYRWNGIGLGCCCEFAFIMLLVGQTGDTRDRAIEDSREGSPVEEVQRPTRMTRLRGEGAGLLQALAAADKKEPAQHGMKSSRRPAIDSPGGGGA
ncbi:hypothetical protein Mth01_08810 [Sphaerimonospora thailandensis]|uniref:Uncharacterized protein n=1 Tax=Sphaerimonospora thailandensis TaxID=795644 RepID=A0A8J3VY51_9ACTN|nr:hypothetical protein Mth01_08810 [Sphaerimonospora thailandensis]